MEQLKKIEQIDIDLWTAYQCWSLDFGVCNNHIWSINCLVPFKIHNYVASDKLTENNE